MFCVEWGSGFRDGDVPKGRQGSVSIIRKELTAVVHMECSALFGESHTRVSVSGSNPNTVLKDLQMKMRQRGRTGGARRKELWEGAPASGLPLRGAAQLREGGGCFCSLCEFAGLLDRGREEATSGGAPAARGCSIERGRRLLLGELPLRGAAR